MSKAIESEKCFDTSLSRLVPTCPTNRKNRGFLRSADVWDSYDQCENPTQTSQTVGNFYDVIGKIGSISTLKVLSQKVPDVGEFYDALM